MSGIVGIFYRDGRPVDPADLTAMVDILAHRGPDGARIWHDGPVGLGHRMLHTTPESLHETLPWTNERGDLTITADARIDNRDELFRLLRLDDRPRGDIADSRLILAAYEKWGERCPEYLLGDFTFAIWDGRKRQLFCARDHMGCKALYYCHLNDVFILASEIKALLCLSQVPRRLNEVKVADLLACIFDDQINTFYQDIFRLPAASCITVGVAAKQERLYWCLDPYAELQLNADQDYVEAFQSVFSDAIRCRLRSAFPVGAALSGGLDSSSIASTAESLLAGVENTQVHTFSAIFPSVAELDPRIDEREYMQAVLQSGQFRGHFVEADHCRPLAETLRHSDEFFPAFNLYMDTALFRAAQEQGVRAFQSGYEGDSTISYGYEFLNALARAGQWTRFAAEVRPLAEYYNTEPARYFRARGQSYLTELALDGSWLAYSRGLYEAARLFDLNPGRLFLATAARPLAPEFIRQSWRKLRKIGEYQGASEPSFSPIIREIFSQRIGLTQRVRRFNDGREAHDGDARRMHVLSVTSSLLRYGLEIFDRVAAPFNLEQRYPFFDRRLVEFCVSLPFDQKLRNGQTRSILRRAMEGRLPRQVQQRMDKQHLGANFRLGLSHETDLLSSAILDDPSIIEPYVSIDHVRDAYRRFLYDPVATSDQDVMDIFIAAGLATWLKRSALSVSRDDG